MTECLLLESESAHINGALNFELAVFELQGN